MKTRTDSLRDFGSGDLGWLGHALREGAREFVEEVWLCGSVALPLGIWWGWSADGLARFVARWLASARPRVAPWPPVALRWNRPEETPNAEHRAPNPEPTEPVWTCNS